MSETSTAAPARTQHEERMGVLFDSLWTDGKIGSQLRAKAKEMFPDIKLPEDQLTPVLEPMRAELETTRAALSALQEERAAEKEEAKANAARTNLESAVAAARDKFGLNGEGLDKMVARMKATENFTDAEAAAAWVKSQEPPPKAAGPSWAPQALNLFGSKNYDEQFALLHKDPQAYQDDQLNRFVADPDGYVAETFGL